MKKQEMMMKEMALKVAEDIAHHEKMRSSVFWSPAMKAAGRRYNEERHTFEHTYEYEGHEYKYESCYSESCRHCYYKGYFYIDGEQKNLRIFRTLLKNLEAAVAA